MDGSYTLSDVGAGEYGVIALMPGYLSPYGDLSIEDTENADAATARLFAETGAVTVVAHQSATHDITLTRGATFNGRVLYSDGSPATQIAIDVESTKAAPSHAKSGKPDINLSVLMSMMLTNQTNITDDEGHFHISGISPGIYRVVAIYALNTNDISGIGMPMYGAYSALAPTGSTLRVYSGDTLHKNTAKTFEVRAGDTVTGIDITIPLGVFHQVHGVLTAKDGRIVNSASLTLTDTTDDTVHFSAKPSDDGAFTFPTVPAGTYKFAVSNARILATFPNTPPETPARFAPRHPVNAFADADTTLIVEDSDVLDVSLPLTEVPLPKDENPGGQPRPQQ
jgi:hypothetical protein